MVPRGRTCIWLPWLKNRNVQDKDWTSAVSDRGGFEGGVDDGVLAGHDPPWAQVDGRQLVPSILCDC